MPCSTVHGHAQPPESRTARRSNVIELIWKGISRVWAGYSRQVIRHARVFRTNCAGRRF